MKHFYDTEFLEDGKTIELISIGIVAEDGRELYLVNEQINGGELYKRICEHNWLMENVVPHLPLSTQYNGQPHLHQPGHPNVSPRKAGVFSLDLSDNQVVPLRYIRNAVRDFLDGTDNELWAWYGAYDHVALAQLFGPMIELPSHIPMYTHDLQQEIERRGTNVATLPKMEGSEHNALADARHLQVVHHFVTGGAS